MSEFKRDGDKPINSIKTITLLQTIENERDRLISLKESDKEWWESSSRSNWARERFGPTLTEKDGRKHINGNDVGLYCDLCGHSFKLEEKAISLDFSFCDEYGCGMIACKKCLGRMFNKLEDK